MRGVISRMIELAHGVQGELRAGRVLDALRLTGSLWDQRVQLQWALQDPDERLRQLYARYAHEVIAFERATGWPLFDERRRVALSQFDESAMEREQRRRRATDGSGRGYAPAFREMARELGELGDYDEVQRWLRFIAHPGFGGHVDEPDAAWRDAARASAVRYALRAVVTCCMYADQLFGFADPALAAQRAAAERAVELGA
jgi:hypothetical protein